jgi:hypothetical protein
MIAIGAIISGANPIPWEYGGRGRAHKARGLPARSRVPANIVGSDEGSDGDADATTQDARKVWRVRGAAPPSDFRK